MAEGRKANDEGNPKNQARMVRGRVKKPDSGGVSSWGVGCFLSRPVWLTIDAKVDADRLSRTATEKADVLIDSAAERAKRFLDRDKEKKHPQERSD